MNTINRSAIVVTAKQRFLDWLHEVDPTSADLTLADLNLEPTAYLLPDYDDEKEALDNLRRVCREIFEEELDGWLRIRSLWPRKRDLNTFRRWFDWSLHPVIIDLCRRPLRHEDYEQ